MWRQPRTFKFSISGNHFWQVLVEFQEAPSNSGIGNLQETINSTILAGPGVFFVFPACFVQLFPVLESEPSGKQGRRVERQEKERFSRI